MPTKTVEIRMLGPLEVRVDGVPVPLGGEKQRALVALLLLNENAVVPRDLLIEEMWLGKPTPTAPAYIQNCVSKLRKSMGDETFETRAPGYLLRIDADAIDARRFERLVREARSLPARERVAALREALALWRGSPLSDLAYSSFAQDAIRNLEEQRVNALQMRLEAELELGLHRESIGELDGLVREHPTHERLRWLQMLALHRSDRRLDALAAYQEVRLAIVEESGMEPGEELRALQRRILQDDPTLMPGGVAAEVTERPPQLARKVVAVCIVELLVDEELDVEAARGLVSRGLASLEEIVLRHGGRVEQLLGEEALAVFGLPAAHEDDLLRALRAVIELRDALPSLPIRAAVETGEVLVGEDGRVLAGGALTTSRRVKEGAGEGEILLGPSAAAQSAGATWTEPSDGGARLMELVEGAPAIARRPDAPLVGRRAELERLVLAVRESAAASACRRVVLIGEPGIGKTRLAVELSHVLWDETMVLTGRCVPYAEGATYLPLVEIVEQITGGEEIGGAIHALLDGEPDGEQAATRLVDALSGAAAVDSGDVFWATRKLLERVAREERPLLVVLEDVHWAEPTFLDLVEYLVGWSTGHAVALVCLARPELLDARPAWAADTMALRPLADDETADLLETLPESLALDSDARAAVVAVAEGNPLFVEQLAAHALDGPVAAGRVPASLESLLASRLDSLGPVERDVLERAAVVGREFTRAAVDAISQEDARGSATALLALVRRRFVRPDSERASEDAFLFDHALIRDATYSAIAKSERARLHEQLARWLDAHGELDEVVGYHLEQAALGRRAAGDETPSLVAEASDRLGAVGERAIWSDLPAAVTLLSRAIDIRERHDPRRLELECLLSVALRNVGEWRRSDELLDDVALRAAEIGDRRLQLRVRVEKVQSMHFGVTGQPDVGATIADLQDAVQVCAAEGDLFGVGRAWYAQAFAERGLRGRYAAAVEAASRAADAYGQYGLPYAADTLLIDVMADGPTPLRDVIAFCESRLEGVGLPRIQGCMTHVFLVWLWAWFGDFEQAYGVLERARSTWPEFVDDTVIAQCEANLELLAGNTERAQDVASAALASATSRELRGHQRSFIGQLAVAAVIQRDYERALALTDQARELALETDVYQACLWRIPRTRALAGLERLDEAETLAQGTLEMVDSTDYMLGRGEARLALADVVLSANRPEEAAQLAEEAAALFDAKGAALLAERARAQAKEIAEGETGDQAPLPLG